MKEAKILLTELINDVKFSKSKKIGKVASNTHRTNSVA